MVSMEASIQHTFKESLARRKDKETTKTRVGILHFMHTLSSICSRQHHMWHMCAFILTNLQPGKYLLRRWTCQWWCCHNMLDDIGIDHAQLTSTTHDRPCICPFCRSTAELFTGSSWSWRWEPGAWFAVGFTSSGEWFAIVCGMFFFPGGVFFCTFMHIQIKWKSYVVFWYGCCTS